MDKDVVRETLKMLDTMDTTLEAMALWNMIDPCTDKLANNAIQEQINNARMSIRGIVVVLMIEKVQDENPTQSYTSPSTSMFGNN